MFDEDPVCRNHAFVSNSGSPSQLPLKRRNSLVVAFDSRNGVVTLGECCDLFDDGCRHLEARLNINDEERVLRYRGGGRHASL